MRYVSTLLGVALLTGGFAMAETSSATARDQLRDLRNEARQVRSSALYIERIAGESTTTWAQMDKQWNQLKPAQEAMVDHLNRLEAMDKSLTPAERQAVKDTKTKIEEITARTRELRATLDQKGVDVKSPKFKVLGQQMARDASAVAHGADLSVTRTASR